MQTVYTIHKTRSQNLWIIRGFIKFPFSKYNGGSHKAEVKGYRQGRLHPMDSNPNPPFTPRGRASVWRETTTHRTLVRGSDMPTIAFFSQPLDKYFSWIIQGIKYHLKPIDEWVRGFEIDILNQHHHHHRHVQTTQPNKGKSERVSSVNTGHLSWTTIGNRKWLFATL